MSAIDFTKNDAVKVDKAHALTLAGLVYGQKPRDVLELGLGVITSNMEDGIRVPSMNTM